MSLVRRARIALTAGVVTLVGIAATLVAPDAQASPLAARLSSASSATEYWDVTVVLDSGERFFARFLVTNLGPGDRTAAAAGHLVRTDGTLVPIQWGRRRDEWTLGAEGRMIRIGKAQLDFTTPAIGVTIDSKKHGIDLRLAIDQPVGATNPVGAIELAGSNAAYGTAVVLPAAAHGELSTDATSARRPVSGWAAITHTWVDRPENERIRRRDELLARDGDLALYLASVVSSEGTRRTTLTVRQGTSVQKSAPSVTFGATSGDSDYPVARAWDGRDADVVFHAALERELVRANPLDVLPQPFRFLLSFGGKPERVWTDARVALDFSPDGEGPAAPTELRGIAVTTFAGPSR